MGSDSIKLFSVLIATSEIGGVLGSATSKELFRWGSNFEFINGGRIVQKIEAKTTITDQ